HSPAARADRRAARQPPLSHHCARLRLPFRGVRVTGRIFLKLILGVFGLLFVALVIVDFFAVQVASDAYIANLRHQLEDKGRMLALSFPEPGRFRDANTNEIARAAGGRITVVRDDGLVIADSEANPAEMENHRTRPELAQAFQGKAGSSV